VRLALTRTSLSVNPLYAHMYTKEEGGTAETKEEAEAAKAADREAKAAGKPGTKPADGAAAADVKPSDKSNKTFDEASKA
jgi:tyrosyl-tRNA synthetase